MSRRKLLLTCLWAAAVYAALSGLALLLTDTYGKAVLPLYRWELSWMAPEYEVQEAAVDRARGEPAFDMMATNKESLVAIDKGNPPRSLTFRTHLLVMHGLEHTLMLLLVPLVWPGLDWRRRALALVCSIPILCLIECLDLPWVMVGAFDQMKNHVVPGFDSLPMIWSQISETGGSFALGLAGGVLGLQISYLLDRRRPRKMRGRRQGRSPASRERAKG